MPEQLPLELRRGKDLRHILRGARHLFAVVDDALPPDHRGLHKRVVVPLARFLLAAHHLRPAGVVRLLKEPHPQRTFTALMRAHNGPDRLRLVAPRQHPAGPVRLDRAHRAVALHVERFVGGRVPKVQPRAIVGAQRGVKAGEVHQAGSVPVRCSAFWRNVTEKPS